MDPVASIAFWAGAFLATHLVIASAAVRPRLIAALGAQPYQGLYSLIALATFIPLAVAYAHNKHAGPMLWNLRPYEVVRWLVWIAMLAAFVLVIAGLINPNPATIGGTGKVGAPHGIMKVTRHPTFVGLGVFGLAHMLMNATAGDLIFFGTFPALAIIGGVHQDRRKLVELGDSYRQFLAQTSFIPGLALIEGRTRWNRADVPWAGIGIGAGLTALILFWLHPIAFGGNPLG